MQSIVGDLIGKHNIIYAPVNKAGVMFMFSRLLNEFDILIEEVSANCNYVIARRCIDNYSDNKHWERVKIVFALKSSEFNNGSQIDGDILICWNNDWPDCSLKTFELKSLCNEEQKPDTILTISNDDSESNKIEMPPSHRNDGIATLSIQNIIPGDCSELLMRRRVTKLKFEQAIKDLDQKIKNNFSNNI
ncbi:MAG: hypothetical protein J7K40_14685 [candidate division Zixibacteria bacterium]|nr:hypothetical protein [candidate division Zixibacteria bacterium]